jgi:hypothetical protein
MMAMWCELLVARWLTGRANPDRGASTVETAIITAAVAAMAIAALAVIRALVDAKIAGIQL